MVSVKNKQLGSKELLLAELTPSIQGHSTSSSTSAVLHVRSHPKASVWKSSPL